MAIDSLNFNHKTTPDENQIFTPKTRACQYTAPANSLILPVPYH